MLSLRSAGKPQRKVMQKQSTDFLYEALILAGGRGERMAGKDKGWVLWQRRPLIEYALSRCSQQTVPPQRIVISANRNADAYEQTGYLTLADERPGYLGPLAGIEAALIRCKQAWLLVLPCDVPLIPLDVAQRLYSALDKYPGARGAYAITDDGPQPLCCLLQPGLAPALSNRLDAGHGKVTDWFLAQQVEPVRFDNAGAFINFNDLDTLQAMEAQQ
jgi:molybdenum cofactor guanylyltransferase